MTDTSPAAAIGLPNAIRDNVVAFPNYHRLRDPLDRKNLEHAFIAMHCAAQYDEDRIEGFVRELIEKDRAGDIADLLNNNARAIRWLMSATDFMLKADEAISEAADRFLAGVLKSEEAGHVS